MNSKDKIELAALLDGEVGDAARAELLAEKIGADTELQAEFEEQREVKSLLASMPEFDSPDFMATRVMGEIASHRHKRNTWLKPVSVTAAALMVLIFTMTTATQLMVGNGPNDTVTEWASTPVLDVTLASDTSYKPQDWRSVMRPEGVTDERVLDFIEFASEAHAYKSLVHTSGMMSPDMAEAILVLDLGGGN